MYYATPFRYLLEGFLGVAVHGLEVRCGQQEFARFAAPPGQTCQSYTQSYIKQAGGYVQNGSDGLCEFCQYATGDEFVSTFRSYHAVFCDAAIADYIYVGCRLQCVLFEEMARLRYLLDILYFQLRSCVCMFLAISRGFQENQEGI